MDEIEYKLESKNPVLISHGISKLFESIKKKIDEQQQDIHVMKIPEFKLLLLKHDSSDPALSMSACQALIALVENGMWDVSAALSALTSSLSPSKNCTAIVTAVSHLLIYDRKCNAERIGVCPFTLHIPQHPFITLFIQNKHNWRIILSQMKFIMNHHDRQIRESGIDILRPVFLYVLCDPSSDLADGCKQEFWQCVIKSKSMHELQIEVLLWLCVDEANTCTETNCRILEVAELALLQNDTIQLATLLPIVASMTIQVLKHGSDPKANLNIITKIVNRCDNFAGNICLGIMAEVVTLCPAFYLDNVLEICMTITTKMLCHNLFLNMLLASILKWMAYPSILCSDALDRATSLTAKILSETKIRSNSGTKILDNVSVAFTLSDSYIRFYAEIVRSLNTWSDENILPWLNNISLMPIDVRDKSKLLLSGLFLQTGDPKISKLVCKILVKVATEIKTFGSHVLSLILHKLSKSRNRHESKDLLLAIPELVTMKENIPIIIHTLDTLLNGEKQLTYFAIELYLKTLEKQPRCYRFVSAALIRKMKTDHSWYSDATCARAMKYICENHSEHGEKLVPLLSQILNRCVDTNSGTASALALNSISALCKSAIIGICSTWRVLAPKMEKEKRPIVLEALCDLFKDIPSCPAQYDEDYDKLINDVVEILWKYVSSTDVRVAESALKALASYRIEQIPLRTLPAEFRCNLALPSTYCKTPADAARNPEDVLPYIPGVCWIQMLQKVNKIALPVAGDLLVTFIKEEVRSFRSGIYIWPQGEPHNFKYLPEKSVIRAVGEYLRRCNKSDSNNHRIIVECLRIFAQRYPKPLPNINWNFLEDTVGISLEAKEYSLSIACHHSTISLSARSFVENYLLKYKSIADLEHFVQSRDYLVLYSSLEDLCQAMQPNSLKTFLEVTLEYVIGKMNLENENLKITFSSIMSSYAKALANSEIHDSNSTLLSTIMERLFDKIDLTSPCFQPYFTAALELSTIHLERITSPRVWQEITIDKLKNAIALRIELILKKRIECPLNWLNECIAISASHPGVQTYLLECIAKVQSELRFDRSTTNWILEFMEQIQGLIVESSQEDSNKIILYCNVLFVSIICLSGMDFVLTRKDLLICSQNIRIRLFPQAIAILGDRQDWKSTIPQVMEWLHYMRSSNIPDIYKTTFCRSLICLRHDPYYKEVWTKYLSTKTVADIL